MGNKKQKTYTCKCGHKIIALVVIRESGITYQVKGAETWDLSQDLRYLIIKCKECLILDEYPVPYARD